MSISVMFIGQTLSRGCNKIWMQSPCRANLQVYDIGLAKGSKLFSPNYILFIFYMQTFEYSTVLYQINNPTSFVLDILLSQRDMFPRLLMVSCRGTRVQTRCCHVTSCSITTYLQLHYSHFTLYNDTVSVSLSHLHSTVSLFILFNVVRLIIGHSASIYISR